MFVVTEFFNIPVNDLNATKTARYNPLFVLTELLTNGAQHVLYVPRFWPVGWTGRVEGPARSCRSRPPLHPSPGGTLLLVNDPKQQQNMTLSTKRKRVKVGHPDLTVHIRD